MPSISASNTEVQCKHTSQQHASSQAHQPGTPKHPKHINQQHSSMPSISSSTFKVISSIPGSNIQVWQVYQPHARGKQTPAQRKRYTAPQRKQIPPPRQHTPTQCKKKSEGTARQGTAGPGNDKQHETAKQGQPQTSYCKHAECTNAYSPTQNQKKANRSYRHTGKHRIQRSQPDTMKQTNASTAHVHTANMQKQNFPNLPHRIRRNDTPYSHPGTAECNIAYPGTQNQKNASRTYIHTAILRMQEWQTPAQRSRTTQAGLTRRL